MATPTQPSPQTVTPEELRAIRAAVPSLEGRSDADIQANLATILPEYAASVVRGSPLRGGNGSYTVSVTPDRNYTDTIGRLAYGQGGTIETLSFTDRYVLEYAMLRWAEANGVRRADGTAFPSSSEVTGTRSAAEVFALLGEIIPAVERRREQQAPAEAVPDSVLVQRIERLALKPIAGEDAATISRMGFEGLQDISAELNLETLSRADKFRLELAIDTLARRHGITSPIARVDGEYEEEEIKADLRAILENPEIRGQFEDARDALGLPVEDQPIRNVVHALPVESGRYTEGYGDRVLHGAPDHHWGNDFGPDRDAQGNAIPTRVTASATGGVLFAMRNHRDFGNCVMLAHADGTYSFYTHLQDFSMLPNLTFTNDIYYDRRAEHYAQTQDAAVTLQQGTPLGMMGNSGPPGTELHLHYEQLLYVNPAELQSGTIRGYRRMPIFETTSSASTQGRDGEKDDGLELKHGVRVGVGTSKDREGPPLP